jgi:phage terminase large subunit-like protein
MSKNKTEAQAQSPAVEGKNPLDELKEKGSVTLTDKDRDALAAQVEKFYTDAAAAEIKLSCGAVGRNPENGIYSIQISKL